MCGSKTENLALNVCHAEADLWRKLAKQFHAKSRGHFQKMVLMLGLAQLDATAAEELVAIREHYRKFGAVALLAVFLAVLADGHHDQVRPARGARVREDHQVNN